MNETYTNKGFILIPNPLQSGNNYKQFASKENSNQSASPRLIVNYDNGTPSPDVIPPYFINLADQSIYDNESFYPLYHKIDNGFLKAVEVLSDSL